MIRFTLAMIFYVVVARWGYAEMQLSMPSLVPVLDSVMSHVQIPTHDHWPKEAFKKALGEIALAWNGSNSERSDDSVRHVSGDKFGWDLSKNSQRNS